MTMKQERFAPGRDEKRVREVLAYSESQTEIEAVAEDESASGRGDYVQERKRILKGVTLEKMREEMLLKKTR